MKTAAIRSAPVVDDPPELTEADFARGTTQRMKPKRAPAGRQPGEPNVGTPEELKAMKARLQEKVDTVPSGVRPAAHPDCERCKYDIAQAAKRVKRARKKS